MLVSQAQAAAAVETFCFQYWNPPLDLVSVGVGLVRIEDTTLPASEHADHCIVVTPHAVPPTGFMFPSHHDGVRVIVKQPTGRRASSLGS